MSTHWSFEPIFDSLLAAGGLSLALAALLALGPTYRALAPRRKAILTALRAATALLVALALFGPTRVSTIARPQRTTLLMLIDLSRSMTLPNAASGISRWDAQRAALEAAEPLIERLSKRLDLRIYGYEGSLSPLKQERGKLTLPETPEGRQTDIGGALHEAVEREAGRRLAAVVVLGDGAQTAFQPRIETLAAAQELARLELPLYAVAFGPAADAAQARDVAVENLQDQYTVFVKNELAIRGTLRAVGYGNKEIPVSLAVEDAAGQRTTVQTLAMRTGQESPLVPFEFSYTPQTAGQYKLIVEAAEQPGEMVADNNHLSAYLLVREGGLRTLLIRGNAWWEQKFLRRALDESPDIELDDLWLPARARNTWPVSLAETLREGKYDAFLLCDIDAAALHRPGGQDGGLALLAEAVSQGKGLAMLGGHHSFGPGGYHETPLARALPVEVDRIRQAFDQPILEALHLQGDLPLLPTRPHFITHLAGGSDNEDAWRGLPPLRGANKLLAPKPRAQVLLETPRGEPLLVAGQFGRGRVLAFAGDSTYRWWGQGHEQEHKRFWRQTVLWLAGRDEEQKDEVWVHLDQRRFNPQSQVAFTLGVRTPTGDPATDVSWQVEVALPDGAKERASPSRQEDQFAATFGPVSQPGQHTITATALRNGQPVGTATARFEVFDRDIELSNPAADPGHLARLAEASGGGRLVAPEELPRLLESLLNAPQDEERVQTRWRLASTAADAWLLFVLLVVLLTSEWALRKKWGLV